jgi:hypothetical protein
MPRLYHPDLDVFHDVPNDRVAATHARSGWVEVAAEDEVTISAAQQIEQEPPSSGGFSDVQDVGGQAPEESPDNQEE